MRYSRLTLGLVGVLGALAFASSPARADDDPAKLYDLSMEATGKVSKGGQGQVTVKITPHKGAEIHKEAPVSLALTAPEALTLSKAKVGRAEMKLEGGNASFEVPFTGAQAGKSTIDATLRFYICTDKTCTSQERKATLPVSVQ